MILLSCIFVVRYLSPVSEGICARNIDKSIFENGLLDTLGGICGKIIDSITNVPIPFATITFFKDGSSIMIIMSDENGEFSTDIKHLNAKVRLSAIGYQERTYYLASDHSNLLRLIPADNILPNVVVSSRVKKMPNADKIIKKVNKNIEQNYGDLSFDQRFQFFSDTRNYDTIKGQMTDFLDLHFYKDQQLMQVKKWRQDTVNYDALFFNFIGVPRLLLGSIIPRADILRRGLVIGEKQRKNFDFRLLSRYQDKKYGAVYLVSFKPHSTYNDFFLNGYTYAEMPLGYLRGEMIIREDDYAVVHLKYVWELKTERLNKSLENLYHSPSWKANRVGKIVSNYIIHKYEYSYNKDTTAGKYFVQTMKADCYEAGYQIENHRKVQLNYLFDATSLGIDNIVE